MTKSRYKFVNKETTYNDINWWSIFQIRNCCFDSMFRTSNLLSSKEINFGELIIEIVNGKSYYFVQKPIFVKFYQPINLWYIGENNFFSISNRQFPLTYTDGSETPQKLGYFTPKLNINIPRRSINFHCQIYRHKSSHGHNKFEGSKYMYFFSEYSITRSKNINSKCSSSYGMKTQQKYEEFIIENNQDTLEFFWVPAHHGLGWKRESWLQR